MLGRRRRPRPNFKPVLGQSCRSGNIREVLIFANFARTNSRIQECREFCYYNNSATKEKEKFANSKLWWKAQNLNTRKLLDLQYIVFVPIAQLNVIHVSIAQRWINFGPTSRTLAQYWPTHRLIYLVGLTVGLRHTVWACVISLVYKETSDVT